MGVEEEFAQQVRIEKDIEKILLKYARTQNSFIRDDGSNGWNEMIEELTIYVLGKIED